MRSKFCVNCETLDNALETMTTAYTEFSSITANKFNNEMDFQNGRQRNQRGKKIHSGSIRSSGKSTQAE